jgi:hypothetical protein
MSKKTLATGTSPFANLMAGFRGKRADDERPEDEEARKARRAEEDQKRQEEDARRAEEDERRKEEDARRAEEDGDGDAGAENEPDDEGDETSKPSGKTAGDEDQDPEADDGDDDLDDEEKDDKARKAFRRGLALGRQRENARASRIFSSQAAGANPALAATLAFTTRNSSAEAIRVMETASAAQPRRRSLDDRMGNRTEARPGADGGTGPTKLTFGQRVASAVQKAGAR